MVHRREGTATGTLFLQPNDDDPKTLFQQHQINYDNSILSPDTDCENLPQQRTDFLSPTKSPNKSKTPSPKSTPGTPTRKGRPISQDRSPRKTPTTPARRALLRDESSHLQSESSDATVSHPPTTQQNGGNGDQFPKPLRSGLLRVGRLQSTSLIEVPTIARKRGRRKTICNSLEDVRSAVEPKKDFGKCCSAENLTQETQLFSTERLTCSLPLDKISLGVMKSLMPSKSNNGSLKNHSSDTDLSSEPVSPFANDLVGLSSPQTAAKLLCLYCDKKFTSQKLLCKHTERVHATDGRRLSSRNSIVSLSWPSIVAYPGCWYCGNSGRNLAAAPGPAAAADDLKALFHHILDVHSDKYYACKLCELRFPSAEVMEEHFTKKHSKDGPSKETEVTSPTKLAAKRGATTENPTHEDLTQPLHVNIDSTERVSPCEDEAETCTGTIFTTKTRRQLKQQAMQTRSTLVTRSCQNVLRNNEDTILTRLGVVQNRLPRGRKGTRNRRIVTAEVVKPEQSPNTIAKARSKVGRVVTTNMKDTTDGAQIKTSSNTRSEPLSCTFDDDFYETVSINVRQNLSCHLDGKLEGGPTSPSPLSSVPTIPAIRSTVVRSPLNIDSEIHEATALTAVTAFPTLLTAEQYGSDWNTERKIKRPITRHSWKWKWDCVKKYKYVNEGGKIVKKIKQPMSGLRDLSKLDMWTQLTMRTKHELTRKENVELTGIADILEIGEVARQEKRKQIAQLNSILDTRVFPQIVLEQTEQSVVKLEPENDILDVDSQSLSGTTSVQRTAEEEQIPTMLHLNRRSHLYYQRNETIILSGEWARPRCYICFSCGGRFDKLKTLEEHKVSRHPYIYSTHYEIVGRELIEGDLYKHLYIPVKALRGHLEYRQRIKDMKSEADASAGGSSGNAEEESMDSVNSLSASTTSANGNATVTTMSTISSLEEHLLAADAASVHIPRRCTKCKRMCNGKLELYRHMLNCSGDYAWRIAQKRKYRYFGVKSRRHARQNFQRLQRRKVVSKNVAKEEDGGENTTGNIGKSTKCNPVRSRPSDADTIRRMLENLPPKRACRQIIPNITKPRCIKFSKNLGLKKLVNAGCNKKVKGKSVNVASTTLTAISSNMRRKQRMIARQITRRSGRMAMRLRELKQNSSITKQKENTATVAKKNSGSDVQEKMVKQPTPPSGNSPQNSDKSLSEKKSAGNGRKNKKAENIVAENPGNDSPDSPNTNEKTPKKKSPSKRGQEKSPKSATEEESCIKTGEKTISPKQSPKRDCSTVFCSATGQSMSKPVNPREPLNLVVPSPQIRSPFLQVSPVNKRQRGKKLTDCIAKLQEKLGKPFFEGNENLDTVLSVRRQSPPQETQISSTTNNYISSTPAMTNAVPVDATRTPKRKTVTRKIIQKTNSEALATPKPALVAPAIKIESEDETLSAKKSTSKEENVSMTSDMCDSLAESDKCDVPLGTTTVPKDNTFNELNDSAVSSMSADSLPIANNTPERRCDRQHSDDIFSTNPSDLVARKSTRRSEKVSGFLPITNANDDYGNDTALNLSLTNLSKIDTREPLPPQLPLFQPPPSLERPTRKSKSSKSPPKLASIETMSVTEEALNLTVSKRRSSVTTVNSSPPNLQEDVFPLSSCLRIGLAKENIEVAKDFTNHSLTNENMAHPNLDTNEPLNLETSAVSVKKEKKKTKSKKALPNLVSETETEVPNLDQACMPDLVACIEPQIAVRKARNLGKTTKKVKSPSDILVPFDQSKLENIITPIEISKTKPVFELTAPRLPPDISLPILPSSTNEINVVQSPDHSSVTANVSSEKPSPDVKRGKGRPRKQNILAELPAKQIETETSVLALNATGNVVSEENCLPEMIPSSTASKKGRKLTSRGKIFTKQQQDCDNYGSFLDSRKEVVDKCVPDAVENYDPQCQTAQVDDSRVVEPSEKNLSTPSAEIENTQPVKENDETNPSGVSSISATKSSVITPTVKKKGRPKKINKKSPPKITLTEPKVIELATPEVISPSKEEIEKDVAISPTSIQSCSNVSANEKPSNSPELLSKNNENIIPQLPFEKILPPPPVAPETNAGSKTETSQGATIPANYACETTHQPGSSGEKSIFDVLRSVQENIFFNRNEGLTRKYTRKGTVSIKKPIAKLMASTHIPSTSSGTPKDDATVAEITLSDGKHLVSSITSETHNKSESVTCVDNQPLTDNKLPETPKKLLNKRRSNRNRGNTQILSDNSGICKELDEIVASFLEDEETTTVPAVACNHVQGPTRFSNIENLLSNDKSAPSTSADLIPSTNLEKHRESEEKVDTGKAQEEKKFLESADIDVQDTNSQHKILCKELSVTLTKISESEIQAQMKAASSKNQDVDAIEEENTVKQPEKISEEVIQLPRRTRTRRLSVKPENVSLTETNNNPESIEAKMISPVISNETKLSRKMSRKRKSMDTASSKENSIIAALPCETEKIASPKNQSMVSELLTEQLQMNQTSKKIDVSAAVSKEQTPPCPSVSPIDESKGSLVPANQEEIAPAKQTTTRRRRKNELAAIVADQLLESFKEVDKSRIDELKKLENLAYEKSEDLFITGIRLTPLTKRKIVLSDPKEDSNPPKENPKPKCNKRKSKSINTTDMAKESDSDFATTDSERPTGRTTTSSSRGRTRTKSCHENLFRNFADSQETPKLNIDPIALPKVGGRNFNLTFGTFRSGVPHEFTFGSQKEDTIKSNYIPGSAETSCSVDSHGNRMQEESSLKAPTETSNSKSSLHRKMKKKMSRFKKEKKAETENINELRSGLESFTFGKNTFQQFGKGVFGSVGFMGLFTTSTKEKLAQKQLSNSMPSLASADIEIPRMDKRDEELRKPFLRPSILSAIVSQDPTVKKASRDPRLNKSKLKVSDKVDTKKDGYKLSSSQSLQELSTKQDLTETFVKPKSGSGIRSKKGGSKAILSAKSASNENNDEEDDDNCLSAIAQSVNNRIMSEEEEFSQTDEFEVGLPSETAESQKLNQTQQPAPHVLDDQRTSDMMNEDENTNTELIDMDLEDDVSIYTSFSQDASCFASGKSKFGHKRRRRRSILLARRPKKPIPDPNQTEQAYDCTICNKTFGKATALAKHQQTFTHVQKLSEYEYLNKMNETKGKEKTDEIFPEPNETFTSTPKRAENVTESIDKCKQQTGREDTEHISARRETPSQQTADEAEIRDTPTAEVPAGSLTPSHPATTSVGSAPTEIAPPKTPHSSVLNADIEPISSPEHAETTTYERYPTSSRIALSQEERLFYECCNMLKGSETPMVERTYPVVPNTYATYDVPNKPVTPKSSERFSYLGSEVTGNFQHGTAYTVKSPMSQSRTSPRYAYPKIDVNQFSDISSDSNPALTRTQHPHIALQPGAEYHSIGDANPSGSKLPFYDQTAISPSRQAFSGEQHLQQHQGSGSHAYHHADGSAAYYTMADEAGRTVPLELSDSTRVLTARTYITDQRGKIGYASGTLAAGYSNVVMEPDRSGVLMGNEQPLTSPLHSNSSQGSNTNITACRMRTKAAMKGYDNFKVSIPTVGLDIQQALERSPHGGCKLTALAEIALGSEAPITPSRYHPHSAPSTPHTPLHDEIYEKQSPQQPQHQQHQKPKPDINEKFAKKYQELIMNNIKPAATKTVKKKEVCDNNTTPKSGYKSKSRRKGATDRAADFASNKLTENNIVVEKPPKDIYEFEEESQEPIDKDAERGSPSKTRNSIVIPERPFKNIGSEDQNTIKFHKPEEIVAQNEDESQMSTTSYSDRDDFNYGSMSEGGGEDSEKEEEQKSSDSDSCASAQTAKTHKCLIMGRIFGNANKNRSVENNEKSAPAAPTTEPKKKIPSQELNEMFDRLRKDGGRNIEERRENHSNKNQSRDISVEKKEAGKGGKTARASRAAARAKKPIVANKVVRSKTTVAMTLPAKRESQRTSKSADPYFPREIAKLQAELGMTAEEIAELIGEGKRKSQRKCAINRPRTVVDTWSSDEYEDFLSTKDVIAFIEEQERRSKKKKPTNKTETKKNNEKNEPGTVEHKESSKENENDTSPAQLCKKPTSGKPTNATASASGKQEKEKSGKTSISAVKDKKPQRVVDRLLQRFNKSRGGARKMESKAVRPSASEPEIAMKLADPAKNQLKESTQLTMTAIEEPTDTNISSKKQPTLSVKPRLKSRRHTDNDSESDFENELRRRKTSTGKRTTSKINKRRKTIAFKEEHNDLTSDSKYVPKPKQSASVKPDQTIASATLATKPTATSAKPSQENSPSTVRPLQRRKRFASEMLYYWSSSSSDEEFGRIETNEVDITQKDEYLPKHGWIVGDSHKKLVTLLATAKGKKMTDLKEPATTTARKKS